MEGKVNTKPNGFLTFLFALIPGIAQLYMGMTKKGLTLLGCFVACIVLSTTLPYYMFYVNAIFYIPMIMIYGYSLFDAFATRRILRAGGQPEDTCALTQLILKLFTTQNGESRFSISRKFIYILGVVVMIVGVMGTLQSILRLQGFTEEFYIVMQNILMFIVPAGLIVAGIILIRRGNRDK